MKFEAREIVAGLGEPDFSKWFSDNVTDKLIRNKQHRDMIERISKYCQYSLKSIAGEIEEWERWTFVRNAIVHVARRVSPDLFRVWPDRFGSVGAHLSITDKELMTVQALAFKIATTVDAVVVDNVIREADALLVVRELFVRFGIDDFRQILRILQKNFAYKMKRQLVDQTIASQRRTGDPISEYDFDSIVEHIDLMEE